MVVYRSETSREPSRMQVIAQSRWFDQFVLVAIVYSSVLLATNPEGGDPKKPESFAYISEQVLLAIFVLEFIVKVSAWGFGYFQSAWNWIDFVVVIESMYSTLEPFIPGPKSANVSALKILRLLRPLRTLKRFPEMQLLVESLLRSASLLFVGFAVVSMCIYVFAAYGYIYFANKLDNRCVGNPYFNGSDYVYASDDNALQAWYWSQDRFVMEVDRQMCGFCEKCRKCRDPFLLGADESLTGEEIFISEVCIDTKVTLHLNQSNFNTMGNAFILVFDLMQLEKWYDVMWSIQDNAGIDNWPYFYVIVIFLNLVILNIFPAIIAFNLRTAIRERENKLAADAKKAQLAIATKKDDETSDDKNKNGGGSNSTTAKKKGLLARQREKRARRRAERRRKRKLKAAGAISQQGNAALFFGGEHEMTQFEEMMVDILAAEEEDLASIKAQLDMLTGSADAKTKAPTAEVSSTWDAEVLALYPKSRPRSVLREIVDPPLGYFSLFIFLIIFINITALGVESLHTPRSRRKVLDILDAIFLGIYLFEVIIKWIAYSIPGYFADGFNVFDFTIVIFALLDQLVRQTLPSYLTALRILRIFRLARVFRLISIARVARQRHVDAAQLNFSRVMAIMTASGWWLVNIFGLMCLLLYMFAILGMIIFRDKLYVLEDDAFDYFLANNQDFADKIQTEPCRTINGCRGRLNFATFPMAFTTVFSTITLDDWNRIMYSAMSAHAADRVTIFLYFALLLVVMRYVVISMILAIIFDQVERDSVQVIRRAARVTMISVYMLDRTLTKGLKRFWFQRWRKRAQPVRLVAGAKGGNDKDDDEIRGGKVTLTEEASRPPTLWEKFVSNTKSWGIFSLPDSETGEGGTFRAVITVIVDSVFWTYFILAIIMISVALVALDQEEVINRDLNRRSKYASESNKQWRSDLTLFCTIIFIFEFLAETISKGVYWPAETAYLRLPANCLDSLVTIISVLALIPLPQGVGLLFRSLRVLRLIRVIRPLKSLVRGSKSVHSMLEALEFSRKGIQAVLLVAILCIYLFAVLGVQLYSGHLFYCSDPEYPRRKPLSNRLCDRGNRDLCEMDSPNFFMPSDPDADGCATNSSEIRRHEYHFDSLGESFKTMVRVFTMDDWHRIVLSVYNGSINPLRNLDPQASVSSLFFFVIFIMIAMLITILFIGVIYGTFVYITTTEAHDVGDQIFSIKQAQWSVYRTKLRCIEPLRQLAPPRQGARLAHFLYNVYRSPRYKFIYTGLILTDVFGWWFVGSGEVTLTPVDKFKEHKEHNAAWLYRLWVMDLVISAVLVLEYGMKIIIFGLRHVLFLGVEQLRFLILIPTATFVIVNATDTLENMTNAHQRAFYALRSFKVFLLVPVFKEMRIILSAVVASILNIVPLLMLAVIVTFLFATVGMILYTRTPGGFELDRRKVQEEKFYIGLRDWPISHYAFHTTSKSMETLFVAATANNWVNLLREFGHHTSSTTHRVCEWLFWVLYVMFFRYLFMNLCTLIVVYKYERVNSYQPWIAMDQVNEFLEAWQQFDKYGVGYMKTRYLARLLRLLRPPLGLDKEAPKLLADRHSKRILMAMPTGLLPIEKKTKHVDPHLRWLAVCFDANTAFDQRGALKSAVSSIDDYGDDDEDENPVNHLKKEESKLVAVGEALRIEHERVSHRGLSTLKGAMSIRHISTSSRDLVSKDEHEGDDEVKSEWNNGAAPDARMVERPHSAGHRKSVEVNVLNYMIPELLGFQDVLLTVHKVAMFPELQRLPDDEDFAARRDQAEAKLDLLRLAVDRYRMPPVEQSDARGRRIAPAEVDLARLMRTRPDMFRHRLRQVLTLETHRWQKQIELVGFDEEAYRECDLLASIVADELSSTDAQAQVLSRLVEEGALATLHERRPRLIRHHAFLRGLQVRIASTRAKHVKVNWMINAIVVIGSMPAAKRIKKNEDCLLDEERKRAVTGLAASKSGDIIVSVHGGTNVTVWRRRKHWKPFDSAFPSPLHQNGDGGLDRDFDPSKFSPYYKTQLLVNNEAKEDAHLVAITADGKRIYTTSKYIIKSWVLNRGHGPNRKSGSMYVLETKMIGHTEEITSLKIAFRHVFSCSKDGSARIWKLRSTDAAQMAYLSTLTGTTHLLAMTLWNSNAPVGDSTVPHADERAPRDRSGLTAFVADANGIVNALPFDLTNRWLQGQVWRSSASVDLNQKEAVGAVLSLQTAHGFLYCGTSTGVVIIIKPIVVAEDAVFSPGQMDSLFPSFGTSDADKKSGKMHPALSAKGFNVKDRSEMRKVSRLDIVVAVGCHSGPVTSLCVGAGLCFSGAADMSVTAWPRPRQRKDVHRKHLQNNASTDEKLHELYAGFDPAISSGRVSHSAAVYSLVAGPDCLFSADGTGTIVAHAAYKYREAIMPPKPLESDVVQRKALLEEEILEKPRFFYQRPLASFKFRQFLASLLWHYYPPVALRRSVDHHHISEHATIRSRKSWNPIDKSGFSSRDEYDSDNEHLDDPFHDGVFGYWEDEDEDGFFYEDEDENEDYEPDEDLIEVRDSASETSSEHGSFLSYDNEEEDDEEESDEEEEDESSDEEDASNEDSDEDHDGKR